MLRNCLFEKLRRFQSRNRHRASLSVYLCENTGHDRLRANVDLPVAQYPSINIILISLLDSAILNLFFVVYYDYRIITYYVCNVLPKVWEV